MCQLFNPPYPTEEPANIKKIKNTANRAQLIHCLTINLRDTQGKENIIHLGQKKNMRVAARPGEDSYTRTCTVKSL